MESLEIAVLAVFIVAVSTLILTSYYNTVLTAEQRKPLIETASELANELNRLEDVYLSYEVEVGYSSTFLDVSGRRIPAQKVYIVWENPASFPYENRTTLFNPWGNATHFGVESWVMVSDTGPSVLIFFISSSFKGRTKTLKMSGEELLISFAVDGGSIVFDGVEVYSFSGYRTLEVRRVVLYGG